MERKENLLQHQPDANVERPDNSEVRNYNQKKVLAFILHIREKENGTIKKESYQLSQIEGQKAASATNFIIFAVL